jgi:hypothetical protein
VLCWFVVELGGHSAVQSAELLERPELGYWPVLTLSGLI